MYLAPSLCTFVEAELQAGFRMFVVDLRHCRGMDSTFMGTFIGLAHKIREKGGWFGLVNVSPENLRLLKMLGVVHLVPVHPGDFPLAEGKTTLIFPTGDLQARKSQIHSAHLLLMDADTENRNRFGSFIRALEEEMNGP
jgi:anti-anti-sigma factor